MMIYLSRKLSVLSDESVVSHYLVPGGILASPLSFSPFEGLSFVYWHERLDNLLFAAMQLLVSRVGFSRQWSAVLCG